MTAILRVLVMLALCASMSAKAYTVFTMQPNFNWKKDTDVFVIGYGTGTGGLFLYTALARARKQMEMNPGRQILMIWAREDGQSKDVAKVNQLGLSLIGANDSKLTMDTTLYFLEKAKSMTSLQFVGHSSAVYGFGLQPGIRFNQKKSKLVSIKRNFAEGAFIYLHGCNSGFISAPELSEIFELPVLGSLTSTDFQQLHNDGSWYWNNSGQYPKGGWDYGACQGGNCYRLKANNHPYNGSWGKYEAGLPFHKAFCNFDLGRSGLFSRKKGIDVCYQGLWNAIKTWPTTVRLRSGIDFQTYKEVVADFLCPKLDGRNIDETCREVLDEAERGVVSTKKFFWGNQLECNFKGCNWGTNIQNVEGAGRVQGFTGPDAGNLSIAREYQLYLSLYQLFAR